jgi:tetratricopeptide (TPR) repeat protein
MFELLLQADRALADGLLDQAERTYWQLIDLDPTNAIAVAGLARVLLERGDEKAAYAFADQALGIDPDSIAARRVIETLTHTGTEHAGPEPTALPLLGAERLEALSRRRGPLSDAAGKGVVPGPRAAKPAPAKPAPDGGRVRGAADAGSPGKTHPDQIGPLPSEPPQERRKASRLAAAAAAAAAVAREPVRTRYQPHHAMPIGRRFFGEGLKVPGANDFSAAEMAAAVEAVDARDEPAVAEVMTSARSGRGHDFGVGDQADLLDAVDATAADESIALRIALVSGMVDLESAEREATQATAEEASDSFEAAEAMASSALHAWDSDSHETRRHMAGLGVDEFDAAEAAAALYITEPSSDETRQEYFAASGADEFEDAEAEAASFLAAESDAGGPIESIEVVDVVGPAAWSGVATTHGASRKFADADADAAQAEAEAAAEAVQEVSDADDAMESDPLPPRRSSQPLGDGEPSEEEAETQALREALAMVLQGEGDTDDVDAAVSRHRAAAATAAAPTPESTPAAEPVVATDTNPEPAPRKGGFFHRIKR